MSFNRASASACVLLQHDVVAEPAISFVYVGTPHLLFEDAGGGV